MPDAMPSRRVCQRDCRWLLSRGDVDRSQPGRWFAAGLSVSVPPRFSHRFFSGTLFARRNARSAVRILSRRPIRVFPHYLFDLRPGFNGSGLGSAGSGEMKKIATSTLRALARRSSRSIDALCLLRSRSLITVRSTPASTARFSWVTPSDERNCRRFQAMRARVSIFHGHHLALH